MDVNGMPSVEEMQLQQQQMLEMEEQRNGILGLSVDIVVYAYLHNNYIHMCKNRYVCYTSRSDSRTRCQKSNCKISSRQKGKSAIDRRLAHKCRKKWEVEVKGNCFS